MHAGMKRIYCLLFLMIVFLAGLYFLRPLHSDRHNGQIDSTQNSNEDPRQTFRRPEVSTNQPNAPVPLQANVLNVVVRNENGIPLSNVLIKTSFRVPRGHPSVNQFEQITETGTDGTVEILWPRQELERMEVTASKDLYGGRKMVWDLKTGDKIPETHSFTLKMGINFGGIVLDTLGAPLSGANVRLYRFWSGSDQIVSKGEDYAFRTITKITDAQGLWHSYGIPEALVQNISIEASHEDFISARTNANATAEVENALRNGKLVFQLQAGLTATGRVVDVSGQPISGAKVWAGKKYSHDRQSTSTDFAGNFTFKKINEGTIDFSVSAEGFAPTSKPHKIPQTTELVLILEKGAEIFGKVVDEGGTPIPGVRVVLEGSYNSPMYDQIEFSTSTDSEGKFSWKAAPNEPMPFYIGKSGYMQLREVILKPKEENIITLHENPKIHGLVLNALTGASVTNFTINLGRYEASTKRVLGSSALVKTYSSLDGSFIYEKHEARDDGILVTAKDYTELIEKLPAAEFGVINVILNLKYNPALTGTVVNAEGIPVPGASVAMVQTEFGTRSVRLQNGKIRPYGTSTSVVISDGQGQFVIPSPVPDSRLVAAVSNVFASAAIDDVRTTGYLKLEAYGRIVAQVHESARSFAYSLSGRETGVEFDINLRNLPDANGTLNFEQVPAGTLSIVRLVPNTTHNSWTHSHRTEVAVNPGQTTYIALGGKHATVSARIQFEGGPIEGDHSLRAMVSTPFRVPEGLSPEERKAYYQSAEYRDRIKNAINIAATISPENELIADSLPPGEYLLTVTAERKGDHTSRAHLGQGQKTFIVPEGTASGQPLPIGDVTIKFRK